MSNLAAAAQHFVDAYHARGPLVCDRATDARALVETLAAERIVASERDDNLRIALHLYNSEGDVDTVLDALRKNRGLLA
jgi:selenocysteine lyase/cysteine desulfurase